MTSLSVTTSSSDSLFLLALALAPLLPLPTTLSLLRVQVETPGGRHNIIDVSAADSGRRRTNVRLAAVNRRTIVCSWIPLHSITVDAIVIVPYCPRVDTVVIRFRTKSCFTCILHCMEQQFGESKENLMRCSSIRLLQVFTVTHAHIFHKPPKGYAPKRKQRTRDMAVQRVFRDILQSCDTKSSWSQRMTLFDCILQFSTFENNSTILFESSSPVYLGKRLTQHR